MLYKVTEITFDLSTGDDSIPDEDMMIVQQELQEQYVNSVWNVVDEDDLVDEVTEDSGWCILSIDYKPVSAYPDQPNYIQQI
jgi:hypothetical protein